MRRDDPFVEQALELVSLVAPVEARRMFGGHGLFSDGLMFGLLHDGELFLKTDGESRPAFLAAGCRCFSFRTARGRADTSYFRPPDAAHEDPEAMLPWARLALDAAVRVQATKRPRATRPPRAPRPREAASAPAAATPRPAPAATERSRSAALAARKPAGRPRAPARTAARRPAGSRKR